MKIDDRYRKLFKQALLIRLVEEKIIELYPFDKIRSNCPYNSRREFGFC